eukprot:g18576.t1
MRRGDKVLATPDPKILPPQTPKFSPQVWKRGNILATCPWWTLRVETASTQTDIFHRQRLRRAVSFTVQVAR